MILGLRVFFFALSTIPVHSIYEILEQMILLTINPSFCLRVDRRECLAVSESFNNIQENQVNILKTIETLYLQIISS